ncbi:MAG TPA: hypothetical protein VHX44_16710, partial [Planctomycetota bacterium]|nr:hypothetical protein [Planctomycetota bacterium]
RDLLLAESPVDGWTDLYAFAGSDEITVVAFVGRRGLIGQCMFTASGALLGCEHRPDETLPIILPHTGGQPRSIGPEAALHLLTHLRYLRERSPLAWVDGDTACGLVVIEIDEEVAIESTSSVHTIRAFGCCTGCFPRMKPASTTVGPEVEPALPMANN